MNRPDILDDPVSRGEHVLSFSAYDNKHTGISGADKCLHQIEKHHS